MTYYDREGNKLTVLEWARLFEGKSEEEENAYRIVKQEMVGDWWVSTVWLGLDHRFGGGVPLIFETMVFAKTPGSDGEISVDLLEFDEWTNRYSTETDALMGHDLIVAMLTMNITDKTTSKAFTGLEDE